MRTSKKHPTSRYFFTILFSLLMAAPTVAQAPAVPAAPRTLWSFLGIPQGARKIHGALFNRRGNRPGLEKGTPLRAINDPRNLLTENKAIKAAAEIKMEEDLKPQKIKAIKYLARIGCGCYDKDGKITDALVAATQDCTEEVRMTAVEEITDAAEGECCSNCGKTCCCNQDMLMAMYKLAYARDDSGCHLEPSDRVRAAAIRALEVCCPNEGPVVEIVDEAPIVNSDNNQGDKVETNKGDNVETIPDDNVETIPDDVETLDEEAIKKKKEAEKAKQDKTIETSIDNAILDLGSNSSVNQIRDRVRTPSNRYLRSTRAKRPAPTVEQRPAENRYWSPQRGQGSVRTSNRAGGLVKVAQRPKAYRHIVSVSDESTDKRQLAGKLIKADKQRGLAHVHLLDKSTQLRVGDRLTVVSGGQSGREIGTVEVIQTFNGSANVRAVSRTDLDAIQTGYFVKLEKRSSLAKLPVRQVSHR